MNWWAWAFSVYGVISSSLFVRLTYKAWKLGWLGESRIRMIIKIARASIFWLFGVLLEGGYVLWETAK